MSASFGKIMTSWAQNSADRRFWIVMVHSMHLGYPMYLSVVDDFGALVRVGEAL